VSLCLIFLKQGRDQKMVNLFYHAHHAYHVIFFKLTPLWQGQGQGQKQNLDENSFCSIQEA
jgi:hypothetical protein